VVATGGNWSQIEPTQKPRKHARTVAVGCNRLRSGPHGKEEVDGSSPSEGFLRQKRPVNRVFLLPTSAPQSTSASASGPTANSARDRRKPCKIAHCATLQSTSRGGREASSRFQRRRPGNGLIKPISGVLLPRRRTRCILAIGFWTGWSLEPPQTRPRPRFSTVTSCGCALRADPQHSNGRIRPLGGPTPRLPASGNLACGRRRWSRTRTTTRSPLALGARRPSPRRRSPTSDLDLTGGPVSCP
jgi:hypothetical protein